MWFRETLKEDWKEKIDLVDEFTPVSRERSNNPLDRKDILYVGPLFRSHFWSKVLKEIRWCFLFKLSYGFQLSPSRHYTRVRRTEVPDISLVWSKSKPWHDGKVTMEIPTLEDRNFLLGEDNLCGVKKEFCLVLGRRIYKECKQEISSSTLGLRIKIHTIFLYS